jgi:homoserine O-acetyltransferase
MDANNFLYLIRANQLFVAGHGASLEEGLRRIQAPVLLIASAEDLVFPIRRQFGPLRETLARLGVAVEFSDAITSDLGHLDGIAHIGKAGAAIAKFLAREPAA